MMKRYVEIDNKKYAVAVGTYIRKWLRSFNTELVSNLIRLNYIDRGPGIEVYSMTLQLATWAPDSLPYKDGITATAEQQMADLEASYLKVSTSLQFKDIFGNPPRSDFAIGILFTNLNQIVPNYSTVAKAHILAEVELTEGAGLKIG